MFVGCVGVLHAKNMGILEGIVPLFGCWGDHWIDPSPWLSPLFIKEGERGLEQGVLQSLVYQLQLCTEGPVDLIAGKPAPTVLPSCSGSGVAAAGYWQASQSGSSMAQAFGTGAGPAAWIGVLSPPLDTALSLPVLMVDFSVLVAARARR
ncbi:hypothetical protein D3C84_806890 [compost metagenome]